MGRKLSTRIAEASVDEDTIKVSTVKKYVHKAEFCHLLWSLVIDILLEWLNVANQS